MGAREYSSDPGDDEDVTVLMWKLSADQWRAIRDAVEDPSVLCKTYKEWVARERRHRKQHASKGYTIREVVVDPAKAVAWCKRQGAPVNVKSFSRYVLGGHALAARAI